MKSKNKYEVECCDMRGMLSFLVLFILSKNPLSGQEIANELEVRRGEKPSPGTIYPALKSLKESGYIKESECPNKKSIKYTLTKEGEKVLRISKEKFCKIFDDVRQ